MSAPAHSRPFDLAAARAGAPYSCRNGDEATVLKWDCRDQQWPLAGVFGCTDESNEWAHDGSSSPGLRGTADLVMLPLGFIDGKPVFAGDEIEDGGVGDWTPGIVHPCNRDFKDCRWPAPPKVYPETLMRHEAMFDVYVQALRKRGYNKVEAESSGLAAVATAALRHAIDAGQVVPVSEAKPGLRPHNPYTGQMRDPRDIESDPMGVLIRHPDEPLRAAIPEKYAAFVGIVNVGTAYGSQRVIDYISNAMLDYNPERRAERDAAVSQATIKSVVELIRGGNYLHAESPAALLAAELLEAIHRHVKPATIIASVK